MPRRGSAPAASWRRPAPPREARARGTAAPRRGWSRPRPGPRRPCGSPSRGAAAGRGCPGRRPAPRPGSRRSRRVGRHPGWCRSSVDLLLEAVELVRELHEVLVGGDGGGAEQGAQLLLGAVHMGGERCEQTVERGLVAQTEPVRETRGGGGAQRGGGRV